MRSKENLSQKIDIWFKIVEAMFVIQIQTVLRSC